MQKLSAKCILAIDESNGIGFHNESDGTFTIPWKIKEDMEFFRETTQGSIVIMGKNTFLSLGGKPLPKRKNIVISSSLSAENHHHSNVTVVSSWKEAHDVCCEIKSNSQNIFIMGGTSLYRDAIYDKCLPFFEIDEWFVSKIPGDHGCNVFFNDIDQLVQTNTYEHSETIPLQQTACCVYVFSRRHQKKEHKMVLCVNTSLKMGKGKIASQCCHAAVDAYDLARNRIPKVMKEWKNNGAMKIACKVSSTQDLVDLHAKAVKAGLVASLVRDHGRTQIAPGSYTVLAIGPAPCSSFKNVTDHLPLL